MLVLRGIFFRLEVPFNKGKLVHVEISRIRGSATAEKAQCRRCERTIHGQSRSFVVVPVDATDDFHFPLALNSNLTSRFNCSCDIMASLHIQTPPLFQVKLEKRRLGVGGHALASGCSEHTLSNHKLISMLTSNIWSYACPSQTDRQTDEHHGNGTTICCNERIVR